jgi:hypothetical protein
MNSSMVCKSPWEYSLWWHKNKNTMHIYFSSLQMENKVKKDKIDTLLELCQNMFNPQEQLISKWLITNPLS